MLNETPDFGQRHHGIFVPAGQTPSCVPFGENPQHPEPCSGQCGRCAFSQPRSSKYAAQVAYGDRNPPPIQCPSSGWFDTYRSCIRPATARRSAPARANPPTTHPDPPYPRTRVRVPGPPPAPKAETPPPGKKERRILTTSEPADGRRNPAKNHSRVPGECGKKHERRSASQHRPHKSCEPIDRWRMNGP